MIGVNNDELPSEKIHDRWAYNDAKMEDELESMLSTQIFEEIWRDVETKLECEGDWIRKNPDALALFIECIYKKELSLPHYETIVKKIEDYYNATTRYE